jgi:hypothetical protein
VLLLWQAPRPTACRSILAAAPAPGEGGRAGSGALGLRLRLLLRRAEAARCWSRSR